MDPRPNTGNCSLNWFDQRVDHFTTLNTTYKQVRGEWHGLNTVSRVCRQRFYVYDKFWKRRADGSKEDGPIFFYCGNEGDVTLYVNSTGLMWENAQAFGALIVFAEHRYFGTQAALRKSFPFGDQHKDHLQYLTHDQALADYAVLLRSLQQQNNVDVPVIAFGGSYGGMLAAWFRIKYPTTIRGAIAASAPIFANSIGYADNFQGTDYWKVVTHDASPAAGSAANCIPNVARKTVDAPLLEGFHLGLAHLSSLFKTCTPLKSRSDVEALALTLMMAWDTMAMGNFPFPSNYLTEGKADMPAFPVRVACDHMAPTFDLTNDNGTAALLVAMKAATDIFTNATRDVACIAVQEDYDGNWDYMWCSQLLAQESYFNTNGVTDMFWARNITLDKIARDCQTKWGVTPNPDWIRTVYGSADALLKSTSNIVFSNGGFDPWSSGGVLANSNPQITLVDIPEGAHHLDLMFSDPRDPASVVQARQTEIQHIRAWLRDA
ncbi:hypothetical protein DYB32_008212 [Aphanomyces invadans]|uniref:Lysosomal Pro-X carboxypeptidase n=1 Tax=Aphanomyces invadans TaxID=157072 RepID=A0A3R6VSE1_9STRA|nr:hypothetical protein DYB32_008212 [Aphanomyces invadans]